MIWIDKETRILQQDTIRKAIEAEVLQAALAGDKSAEYWDWGPGREENCLDLILAALDKLGIPPKGDPDDLD